MREGSRLLRDRGGWEGQNIASLRRVILDPIMQAFCLCTGKITQGKNNSRPTITQGFFKITQENFGNKLMVPEVFGLI